jgi:hypothetical protein
MNIIYLDSSIASWTGTSLSLSFAQKLDAAAITSKSLTFGPSAMHACPFLSSFCSTVITMGGIGIA